MTQTFESSCYGGNDYRNYNKQIRKVSGLMIFVTFFFISCVDSKKRNHEISTDDNTQIQMGGQVWMAKNLDLAIFRNGDSIPQVKSNDEWEEAGKEGKPAWCYYENDTKIGRRYGRMYNWYAVNDPRGLCPKGGHIPTNDEWIILENFVGSSKAGLQLKSSTGWNNTGNGNKNSGFSAMPGGYRDRNGNFTGAGEFTYLSGITQDTLPNLKGDERFFIWGRGLHSADSTIMRCGLNKKFGLYVRCIKD